MMKQSKYKNASQWLAFFRNFDRTSVPMSIIALYVQKGETPYRKFFQDNLYALQLGFQRRGLNLVFLPAITQHQNPNFTEGLRQYLEVYYPSFRQLTSVQQQQALFIVASTSSEDEVYQQLDHLFGLNLQEGAFLFYLKPGHFEFERLPADVDPADALSDFLQFRGDAHVSASIRKSRLQLDPYHLEEFMASQDWDPKQSLSQFDFADLVESKPSAVQSIEKSLPSDSVVEALERLVRNDRAVISAEMQRLFDTVNALQLDQGMRELLDITLVRYSEMLGHRDGGLQKLLATQQPMRLLQPLQRVHFNADGKLFVGDTLLKMNPICRSVYRLFLNHPEGIDLPALGDHRQELLGIYVNMATHTNRAVLEKRIQLICDPRENSINEKLSTINRAFEDLLGEEDCLPYQIMGIRGGPKKINLRPEYRG
jgi:hypothetical protein